MTMARTHELIERLFWAVYRGSDRYQLNPAQWAALRFFADPANPKRTSSEFAKFHQTTRGTANQTVLALMRKGYLKRDVSPTDHRSKAVSVTPEGLKALEEDPSRLLERAVARLDNGDREHLQNQLLTLYEGLRRLQLPAA